MSVPQVEIFVPNYGNTYGEWFKDLHYNTLS